MKILKLLSLIAGLFASVSLVQAQQYAPATLGNVIFNGVITAGTGGAATSGVINSLLSNTGIDYTQQSNGSLSAPAPFVYTTASGTTATLTENALGALPSVSVALTFASATTGTFVATYGGGGTQNGTFTLVPVGTVSPLANVSTLTNLIAGNSAITGFVLSGTGPHKILIRAIGPTLAQYGVSNPLANPAITVWQGTTVIAMNDDWNTGSNVDATLPAVFAQVGAFSLPSGSKDSALIVTLNPGVYSAQIVGGNSSDAGRVLMEVYLVQ